jgi:hypothetical protein
MFDYSDHDKKMYNLIKKSDMTNLIYNINSFFHPIHNDNDILEKYLQKFMRIHQNDTREIILELINYRDYLLSFENVFGVLKDNNNKPKMSSLEYFLLNRNSYRIDDHLSNETFHIYFSHIVKVFYDQYPQFIPNTNLQKDQKDQIICLHEALIEKDKRIKLLEQYQASILDKMEVLTEMIDNIQKQLDKQKNIPLSKNLDDEQMSLE